MRRKYKRILKGLVFAIVIIIIVLLLGHFFKNLSHSKKINIIDTVENFDYALEDRDTVLYKNIHQELKTNLESDNIDYDKYAEQIAKLFVVDLFTMENKLSTYDVGGVEFIYPDVVDNYKLNVEQTVYKNIESNGDGKRNQTLPVVKSIEVVSNETGTFNYQDKEMDAYIIELSWDYEKDLGYDKKATVTIVKKDDKLFIVEYKVNE